MSGSFGDTPAPKGLPRVPVAHRTTVARSGRVTTTFTRSKRRESRSFRRWTGVEALSPKRRVIGSNGFWHQTGGIVTVEVLFCIAYIVVVRMVVGCVRRGSGPAHPAVRSVSELPEISMWLETLRDVLTGSAPVGESIVRCWRTCLVPRRLAGGRACSAARGLGDGWLPRSVGVHPRSARKRTFRTSCASWTESGDSADYDYGSGRRVVLPNGRVWFLVDSSTRRLGGSSAFREFPDRACCPRSSATLSLAYRAVTV